ncbi:unnamed protein product [Trichobilharzia regenti]|nr:unnamed protein product [Trichobilharzia regenti]
MPIYDYEGYVDNDEVESNADVAIDPAWELQQKKQIDVIENDFRDGLKLMKLLEVISGERLPKPDRGKMRFHKIANVNKALDFIESKGVKLVSIGAEDMVISRKCDERSVMAYLSSYYHAFSGSHKTNIAATRIANNLRMIRENNSLIDCYETISSNLLTWIQMKLEEFGSPYVPAAGRLITDVAKNWSSLEQADKVYEEWLLEELQRLERLEYLAKKFEVKCSTHEAWTNGKPEALASNDFRSATLAEMRAFQKKHEAFQSDMTAHHARIERIQALSEELNKLNHFNMQAFNQRYKSIVTTWDEMKKLSAQREREISKALTALEEIDQLHLDFAKRAATGAGGCFKKSPTRAFDAISDPQGSEVTSPWLLPFNNWMEQTEEDLRDTFIVHTMPEVERLIAAHQTFESTLDEAESESRQLQLCAQKVEQIAEEYKLVNANQNPYTNIKPHELPQRWNMIRELTQKRSALLHSERERQLANDKLRREFAQKAEAFNSSIETHRAEIVKVGMESRGALEDQRNYLQKLEAELNKHQNKLNELEHVNQALEDAFVFENPYTVYSMPTLRVAWEQLFTLLHYSVNEIDNQILTRDSKGLTAEQMNDLRTCFKHFDKNNTGRLEPNEFKACLVSLGYNFRDDIKNVS